MNRFETSLGVLGLCVAAIDGCGSPPNTASYQETNGTAGGGAAAAKSGGTAGAAGAAGAARGNSTAGALGWANDGGTTNAGANGTAGAASGIATESCVIGFVYYANGAGNPGNACQICQTATAVDAWTSLPQGSSCGDAGVCSSGSCQTGCWIDGTYYAADAVNPSNGCQYCRPGVSTASWASTFGGGGTGCLAGQVCHSGSCSSGCWIDGTYHAANAVNPSSGCQSCQPATSTTIWSPLLSDGASCGTGQVCHGGACEAGCWIGGAYFGANVANPLDSCQSCQPALSVANWSPLSDGASCGTSLVCHSQSCQAGCWIGEAFYPAGAVNPSNGCRACQPSISTVGWSPSSEAAQSNCPSGQVCHNGACLAGCGIGGRYFTPDTPIPSGLCRACKPMNSTTAWSTDAASCGCTGSLEAVDDPTGRCVAKQVTIQGTTGTASYGIDATEVTRLQYATWLASNPPLPPTSDVDCGWMSQAGAKYTVEPACMVQPQTTCQDTAACAAYPQVCVTWCGASAYCDAVGKHLCGKIGGGASAGVGEADASLNQWYRACSSGGTNAYPYGPTYNSKACNGSSYWATANSATATPAGSLPGCQSAIDGFAGVFDLSGNVAEWEASCPMVVAGPARPCNTRGGSYQFISNAQGAEVACGRVESQPFGYGRLDVGFRCCSN